jgi:hypothetical protein
VLLGLHAAPEEDSAVTSAEQVYGAELVGDKEPEVEAFTA